MNEVVGSGTTMPDARPGRRRGSRAPTLATTRTTRHSDRAYAAVPPTVRWVPALRRACHGIGPATRITRSASRILERGHAKPSSARRPLRFPRVGSEMGASGGAGTRLRSDLWLPPESAWWRTSSSPWTGWWRFPIERRVRPPSSAAGSVRSIPSGLWVLTRWIGPGTLRGDRSDFCFRLPSSREAAAPVIRLGRPWGSERPHVVLITGSGTRRSRASGVAAGGVLMEGSPARRSWRHSRAGPPGSSARRAGIVR